MLHLEMRELFYFAFADLMARVEYDKEANSLRYAFHRQVKFQERAAVEQYILTAIAPKTEFYKKQPARFIYLGVDSQLANHLKMFHLKNSLKTSRRKEKKLDDSIHRLINQSMQSYYFDKIGDTILSIRRALENDRSREKVISLKGELDELVKAYNLYSTQEIKIDEVIPEELQWILKFLSRSTSKTGRPDFQLTRRMT